MCTNYELHRTCITYPVLIGIPVLFLVRRKRRPETVYRTQLGLPKHMPSHKRDVLTVSCDKTSNSRLLYGLVRQRVALTLTHDSRIPSRNK